MLIIEYYNSLKSITFLIIDDSFIINMKGYLLLIISISSECVIIC